MVVRAELANQLRLAAVGDAVETYLEAALHAPISAARRPTGPAPVTSPPAAPHSAMRPPIASTCSSRLREHAHRLEQDAEETQVGVESQRELGLDAEAL